jgi:putative FmdB family regulatory protein
MPIYTYRCENCGVVFDRKRHFDDKPLVKCLECGKESLRKVYQPVGIVFKGSGFYATDHRSPSGQDFSKKSEEAVREKEERASTEPSSSSKEKKSGDSDDS